MTKTCAQAILDALTNDFMPRDAVLDRVRAMGSWQRGTILHEMRRLSSTAGLIEAYSTKHTDPSEYRLAQPDGPYVPPVDVEPDPPVDYRNALTMSIADLCAPISAKHEAPTGMLE